MSKFFAGKARQNASPVLAASVSDAVDWAKNASLESFVFALVKRTSVAGVLGPQLVKMTHRE